MVAPLKVGIAGLGTVGAEVVRLIEQQSRTLSARSGRAVRVVAVTARSKVKKRGLDLRGIAWAKSPLALAGDPGIDCFVELMGGAGEPALSAIEAALKSGKSVVTANKALIAKHGLRLAKSAEKHGGALNFEAAVGAAIPVIKTLREGLAGTAVNRVYGILNGTCNYILTRMEQEGLSFAECLKDAQRLGYAEANPSFDVDGHDTAQKLAILTSLTFGTKVAQSEVYVEGNQVRISGPREAVHLGIEVVYQDLALCDNLDVVQNMYLGREAHNPLQVLQEPVMEQRTSETLKGLAVTTIRSIRQQVATLSGGQRQSVAVARAVMWNSKLVILDEPTAALGVAQTEQVLELVKRLGEQGLAVILISHNLHDVFVAADRISVLRLGRNAGLFTRLEVTQEEVVHAITAGAPTKVSGITMKPTTP
jgi:homoserine dehydrogenase